ncbi:uncharacterized protein N7498_010083 [Penicillium cinerascens]|uniref:Uncharacterized protein n=1 Tax=Penicillium cinerascens TaxID=70096 RepID=A0A9W9J5S2_9EURO|nr:uncharacterized protein N7498_010083 [Penicillium cinerascens]KAJ5191098.1 hypothetical protein N7498_010083 [Penicillium cinerascens]
MEQILNVHRGCHGSIVRGKFLAAAQEFALTMVPVSLIAVPVVSHRALEFRLLAASLHRGSLSATVGFAVSGARVRNQPVVQEFVQTLLRVLLIAAPAMRPPARESHLRVALAYVPTSRQIWTTVDLVPQHVLQDPEEEHVLAESACSAQQTNHSAPWQEYAAQLARRVSLLDPFLAAAWVRTFVPPSRTPLVLISAARYHVAGYL